jgi:hypothetical protein
MSAMSHHNGPHQDDDLMKILKQALTIAEGEEARLLAAAKAAFTWRTLDEELELLSLSYDSAMFEAAVVRSDHHQPSRMLVFENDDLVLQLEAHSDVLMGQLIPPCAGTVVLENPQGRVGEARADDAGIFLLRRATRGGPVRLRVEAQPAMTTEWLPF